MSIVPVCWLEGDNGSIGNPNISVMGVRIGDCRSLQADFGRIPGWSGVLDPDFYPAIAQVSLAANFLNHKIPSPDFVLDPELIDLYMPHRS